MNQDEFVIFAELDREHFESILERLKQSPQVIQSGRQGDDWIWINFRYGKIEIDTFYSMNLEVKGRREQYDSVNQLLKSLDIKWIIAVFNPPKIDLTK